MGALTIWKGKSSEAALAKVTADRAAILARIAEHDAKRASELVETDDIAAIDAADLKVTADRRAVAILDQKIKVFERRLRQEAHDHLEAERGKAIKAISGIYGRRTAKGARVEELLGEMVAVIRDIKADEDVCSDAWKLGGLPHWFTWRHDIVADLMPSIYYALGDLLPSNVRAAISYHAFSGSPGFTEAPKSGPPAPRDVPGKLAANAKSVLESLRAVDIHPPELVADDEAEAA